MLAFWGALQMGRKSIGSEAWVYVIYLQSLSGGEGEAGPDDAGGVEGWDEEGQSVGGDVVGKMAVGQSASGEIEEMASLSGRIV